MVQRSAYSRHARDEQIEPLNRMARLVHHVVQHCYVEDNLRRHSYTPIRRQQQTVGVRY